MQKLILTCPCGHQWEHSPGTILPDDLRRICPRCSSTDQPTSLYPFGESTPADSSLPLPKMTEPQPAGTVIQTPDQVAASARASMAARNYPSVPGFEIMEELARGGMGVVYKARQLGLNRVVALKVISPERLRKPEAMSRFQREVRAAALLCHPHIVTVFHTDLNAPQPFLAMEYVDGIDLYTLVQKVGPLSVEDAVMYVRQAALGLQHAYERGMVHRDIKPANLMVMPSPLDPNPKRRTKIRFPLVKILDMGLARVENAVDESGQLTQAGEFLGTPDYIAPEQAEDPRSADIRSDLYSLGGTLFYLLTGDVPFPGGSVVQKLKRQMTEPVPLITQRRSELSPMLAALVAKLMAKSPGDRFQKPMEFVEAADGYLRGAALPGLEKPPAPAAPVAPMPTVAPAQPTMAAPIPAHPPGVQCLALSNDGKMLLTGGLDDAIRLWDTSKLREIRTFSQDAGSVNQVAFSPKASWAASCSLRLMREDMVVQLWDVASGKERKRLRGPKDNVTCISIGAEGRKLAAGSVDRTIHIWNMEGTAPPLVLKGHIDQVSSVIFLAGAAVLLSGSHDGTLRRWDALTGTPKGNVNAGVGRILALAYSPNGNRVAMAGDGGEGLRMRQPDGSYARMTAHRGAVHCVAFSPDGKHLLSGGNDGVLYLWRVEDAMEIKSFDGHTGKVTGVVFTPEGNAAYSCGADGTIRRWQL